MRPTVPLLTLLGLSTAAPAPPGFLHHAPPSAIAATHTPRRPLAPLLAEVDEDKHPRRALLDRAPPSTHVDYAEEVEVDTDEALATGGAWSFEERERGGIAHANAQDAIRLCEWVPTHLALPLIRCPDSVAEMDLEQLRRDVFGIDSFYVTKEDRHCAPIATLFMGNMRRASPEEAMDEIDRRLRAAPGGLSSRVSLFLVELPSEQGPGYDPQMALLAAPSTVTPNAPVYSDSKWSIASLGLSVASCVYVAYLSFAANADFFDRVVPAGDWAALFSALAPVTLGLLGIQGVHELAHAFTARKWGMRLGSPLLLPSLELGVFGAITPIESFPRNKRALFDVAVSGPLAAMAVSLSLFILGLALSPAPTPEITDAHVLSGVADSVLSSAPAWGAMAQDTAAAAAQPLPSVSVHILHQSYLLASLGKALLPQFELLALTDDVLLHPLALVGMCGTLYSALNFMPVGRLDGGTAMASAFGRDTALRVGYLVLLIEAMLGGMSASGLPSLYVWGMLLNTMLKRLEVPPMEELTPVDDGRRALLLGCLLMVLMTALPYTG